ncbi:outer membrane protein assembly factor BamB family protein [Paractinoplanes ferrugineus]|uniref:outer membrane protein assembly factor BamB family protein n=1 Tax=Paractinoplanes ferrugineus TaxID=113564 RepID=UPI0031D5F3AA
MPPPPVRRRPRPVRPRHVVVALLLLLLGGAASPARLRPMVEVAGSGGLTVSSYRLGATALYTAQAAAGGTGAVVRAAPVVPGGPRWSVPVSAGEPTLELDDTGSTLVVSPGRDGRITFLDARTGKVRWRTSDYAIASVAGDRVVVDSDGVTRMADLVTGRTLWQRPGPAMVLDTDPAHRTVLAVDQQGLPSLLSADDGHLLSGGRGRAVDPWEWAEGGQSETIIGDTLYLHTDMFLAAYRLPDLRPRWRVRIAEPDTLAACGTLICATGGRGVTAIDPATGGIRWTGPRWRSITPDGLAVADDLTAARLDPADGRVVRTYGRGAVAGDLLLRNDRDRTWVTGLVSGEILGVLPLVVRSRSCSLTGDYLVCPGDAQAVTVWKVR